MYKFIASLLLSISLAKASLFDSTIDINKNDFQVLKQFDIDSSFITDEKLQKIYHKHLSRSKNKYLDKIDEATLFLPSIKEIIQENGIPPAFVFLLMAESNFVVDAKSYVKAAGLWQFMPQTAKNFGLKNNTYVDERMDILKSTKAAVEYLKYLHKKFGKWYLAAIAYNCGEGRVIEAITRATIDIYVEENGSNEKIREYRRTIKAYQQKRVKFRKLFKIYKEVKKWNIKPDIDKLLTVQTIVSRQYIPEESQNYIRKIISLAMMSNKDFITSSKSSHILNVGVTNSLVSANVKGGTHLKAVANVLNMNYKELANINKHIKQYIVPPEEKSYSIYIPYDKLSLFHKNKVKLDKQVFAMHTVKAGESLGKIGAYYKVSYKVIKKFNKLKSNFLKVNQKLIIPVAPENMPRKSQVHHVRSGDTLSKIAKIYDVKLKKLMSDNNLKNSFINIGDRIVINYR